MKVGINIDNEEIFVTIGEDDGIQCTGTVTPDVARFIANQLFACANVLDSASVDGLILDVPKPPESADIND